MSVEIVIPSHKRAGRVSTVRNVDGCLICVPESQGAEYRAHYGDAVVTHPDSVVGIGPKRQWIIERWPDVFMVDDDCTGIRRLWKPSGSPLPSRLTPSEARNAILQAGETARQLGAYVFGFSNTGSPTFYSSHRPFRFGYFLPGTTCGVLRGHRLHYPARQGVGEDLYFSLLCMHRHRFMFIDNRFYVATKDMGTNPGGMREFEGKLNNDEALRFLVRMFGPAIRIMDTAKGWAKGSCPWRV